MKEEKIGRAREKKKRNGKETDRENKGREDKRR